MKIITDPIPVSALQPMTEDLFEDMVKAVVDVERGQLAVHAELHSDLEALLLEEGSRQSDLWGINLYPALFGGDDFIEFDSMINIKPSQGNRSRGVGDENIRRQIIDLVNRKVREG